MSKYFNGLLTAPRWLQRLLLVLGVLVVGVWLGLLQSQLLIQAPKVSFTTLKGEVFSLDKLQGQPVLVTFWATDCASCVKEIPDLIALYQQYHARGLELFAVNMYYDLPSHVVEMTRQKQLPYHVVLDIKAAHARAFGSVQLTPTTLLIAPDGTIVNKWVGALQLPVLQAQIEQYL